MPINDVMHVCVYTALDHTGASGAGAADRLYFCRTTEIINKDDNIENPYGYC